MELEKDYRLSGWVSQQRVALRKGRLGEDRARRLDMLGFVWEPG